MEQILEIINDGIGWQNLLILFCLIITTLPSIIKGFDYLVDRFGIGIETKGSKSRKEQANKCTSHASAIKALEDKIADYDKNNKDHWQTSIEYRDKYTQDQAAIMEQLASLTNMINSLQKKMDENELKKRISSLRTDIISFGTSLGNPQFHPSFEHYNIIYAKVKEYEKILEDHNLKNGQCSASIKIIDKHYEMAMERGDFLEHDEMFAEA